MKNALLFSLGLFTLASVACSKDDDEADIETPPPTAAELITSNTWRIDTMGMDGNNDGTIDMALPFPLAPCALDNTLTFSSDSTGVFSEGATKCNGDAPDTKSITWHLESNDQTIFIDGLDSDLDGNGRIVSLTDSTFVISRPVNYPGVSGHLIVSLIE